MLARTQGDKFELLSLFNPPVLATLVGLGVVFLGLGQAVPQFIFKPLKMIGDSALPLAMLVVGGNLAQIRLSHIDKKAMILVVLGKLIIMPALGILLIAKFRLPQLLGMLLLIQLAMPSATSSSVIIRHYKKEDLLVSQGIFISHILSILTIPLFLSLYFSLVMIK
jgi:predicted permease